MPPSCTVRRTATSTPQGNFHKERQGAADKPVYEVELRPDDGLYPLPYMARQADGAAWDADGTQEIAPANQSRQPFFPDGSRPVEEIDRLQRRRARHRQSHFRLCRDRLLPRPAAVRLQEGTAGRSPHRRRRGRHSARDARQRLLSLPPAAPRSASAAALGLARIVNAVQAALAERQVRRRDLDAGQSAHRRDALLAEPAARHDAAAVRQLGPACARHDQQRRTEEPGRLGRFHHVARLGGRQRQATAPAWC